MGGGGSPGESGVGEYGKSEERVESVFNVVKGWNQEKLITYILYPRIHKSLAKDLVQF